MSGFSFADTIPSKRLRRWPGKLLPLDSDTGFFKWTYFRPYSIVLDIIADLDVSARVNFLFQFLFKNNFSVSRNRFWKMGPGGLKMENFERICVLKHIFDLHWFSELKKYFLYSNPGILNEFSGCTLENSIVFSYRNLYNFRFLKQLIFRTNF